MSETILELGKRKHSDIIRKVEDSLGPGPEELQEFSISLDKYISLKNTDSIERVKVDVNRGTWIKEIAFPSRESVIFGFNEGTTKTINQANGIYSIGESTYYFHGSGLKTDMHVDKHNLACDMIFDKFKSGNFVSNGDWLDILYHFFPDARKNNPDYLYNFNDVSQVCKRIEHFRNYVTCGITTILESIPDENNLLICTVAMSNQSKLILSGILSKLNASRRYALTVYETGLNIYQGSEYVYYLTDIWQIPSSLDHGLVAGNGNRSSTDSMLERAIGSHRMHFCGENSTLIAGAYHPILDISSEDGVVYRRATGEINYSQLFYVPHKPWSIVCLTRGPVNMDLPDTSTNPETEVYKYRIQQFFLMTICNLLRNGFMTGESQKKLMKGGRLLNFLKQFKFTESRYYRAMQHPVRVRAKKVAYEVDEPVDAIDLIMRLGELTSETPYSTNDLYSLEWSQQLINRAVSTGMLIVKVISAQNFYYKFTRTQPRYTSHMNRIREDVMRRVAILSPLGKVMSANPKFPDYDALVYPQVDYTVHNGRSYDIEAPYDVVETANAGSAVASLSRMEFRGESTEDHCVSNVQKRKIKEERRKKKNTKSKSKKKGAKNKSSPESTSGKVPRKKNYTKNRTDSKPVRSKAKFDKSQNNPKSKISRYRKVPIEDGPEIQDASGIPFGDIDGLAPDIPSDPPDNAYSANSGGDDDGTLLFSIQEVPPEPHEHIEEIRPWKGPTLPKWGTKIVIDVDD